MPYFNIKYYCILLIFSVQFNIAAATPLPIQLRTYFSFPTKGASQTINTQVDDVIDSVLKIKKIFRHENLRLTRELIADKSSSKELIKNIFKTHKIGNIIVPEFLKNSNGLYTLKILIYNKKLNIIFKKISQNNKSIEKNIILMKSWIQEYFANIPPVGIVTSFNPQVSKSTINIKFEDSVDLQKLKGRNFKVYCISTNCTKKDNLYRDGMFYEVNKGSIKGFLYTNSFQSAETIYSKKWVVVPSKKQPTIIQKNIEVSSRTIDDSPNYSNSVRGCFTLPFIGNVKKLDQIRQKFISQVENDGRCINRVDPKIMKILERYKLNLNKYLHQPKVIKTIANKSSSGTIFRVKINRHKMGVLVSLHVVGQNGTDIYFGRSKILNEYDPGLINNLLYQWVLKYVRALPLDASVLESVEQNILFDLGRKAIHRNDQYFEIIRPLKLTTIKHGTNYSSKWEGKVIAQGVTREIHKSNSMGYILTTIDESTAIKAGDWVKLAGFDKMANAKPIFMKHNIKSQRNRFRLNGGIDMSKLGGSSDYSKTVSSIYLGLDIFFPYGILGFIESERDVGNLSDFSLTKSNFKAALGYSTIIDGNLLVSLFDFYIGYMNSFLETSELQVSGLGDLSYKGPYAAIRFEAPIYTDSTLHLGLYGTTFLEVDNSALPVLFSSTRKSKMVGAFIETDYKIRNNFYVFGQIIYESFKTEMDQVSGQPEDVVDVSITKTKLRVGVHWDF